MITPQDCLLYDRDREDVIEYVEAEIDGTLKQSYRGERLTVQGLGPWLRLSKYERGFLRRKYAEAGWMIVFRNGAKPGDSVIYDESWKTDARVLRVLELAEGVWDLGSCRRILDSDKSCVVADARRASMSVIKRKTQMTDGWVAEQMFRDRSAVTVGIQTAENMRETDLVFATRMHMLEIQAGLAEKSSVGDVLGVQMEFTR